MKIVSGSQQQKVVQPKNDNLTEAAASVAQQQKTAEKQAQKGDTVQFSASLEEQLNSLQTKQAQRVDSIKGELSAGTYQVSSFDVAAKMLAAYSRK